MEARDKEDPQLSDVGKLHKQVEELMARIAKLESNCAATGSKTETSDSEDQTGKREPLESEKSYPSWHVRFITNKRDLSSGERKDFEEIQPPEVSNKDAQGAAAALKIFVNDTNDGSDDVQPRGQLEIFNRDLRDLLRGLLAHHPTHDFYTETVKLETPFEPLILNWDLLTCEAKKESESEKENDARKALATILELLQHQNTGDSQLNEYMSARETLTTTNTITFEALWTIFPPGTIVYGNPYLKQHQVFIVKDNREVWPESDSDEWDLRCWTYDWDGQSFQRRGVWLTFPKFSGSKPIASLSYHPLSYNRERDTIKEVLIRRGRQYRKYCIEKADARRFKYEGKAIVDKMGFKFKKKTSQTADLLRRIILGDNDDEVDALSRESMVNSDVMVDFESYYQYGPQTTLLGRIAVDDTAGECSCAYCSKNDALAETYCRKFDEAKGEETEEWDDRQYMLCPPRVLGYILRQKEWAQLEVDKIKPVIDHSDAFKDKLHLRGDASLDGEETKRLLFSLVSTHGQGQVKDLVEDKGKGLVILLYGKPGVGKTSTAETLAAAIRRPLLTIGVADVGTEAKHVESNLKRVFDLATRWKAILLIDEVDVFVQSRAMGHQGPTTERNALVSVFLRILEYYQGILILTTNQIALFDVAVQSRIHIAIKYEELDKSQAVKIFEQFLDQYHKDGLVAGDHYLRIKKHFATDLVKKGFDGRQLRNIVASAMGLAQARRPGERKMTLEDVTTIVSNNDSFKSDLEYQMRRYLDFQTGRPPY